MKIPSQYIRRRLKELLHNQITYEGSAVPVYENDGVDGMPVQILIADYSDTSASTWDYFGGNARQVIEVMSFQPTAMRKIVDDVGSVLTAIMQPDTKTDTLSGDEFQVHILGRPDITYLTENSGRGNKIVRLILTYRLRVIER